MSRPRPRGAPWLAGSEVRARGAVLTAGSLAEGRLISLRQPKTLLCRPSPRCGCPSCLTGRPQGLGRARDRSEAAVLLLVARPALGAQHLSLGCPRPAVKGLGALLPAARLRCWSLLLLRLLGLRP